MTDELYDLLVKIQKLEEEQGWLSEYVFCDGNGPLTSGKITSCLHNKCRQLGLDHEYSTYNIRKTANSIAKAQGSTTMDAASLLGHTAATNERYYTKDVTTDKARAITASRMNLSKWAMKNRGQHRSTQFSAICIKPNLDFSP